MASYRWRTIPSSFNGIISEIPGISVDNFEKPSVDGAKAYFLSHYHTDHTVGLNEEYLRDKLEKRNNIFIYATKLTAAMIVHNNNELEGYVKVLDLGPNLITLPGDSDENESENILNVTLIPAGHCLGSTMFLFETTAVKVLYSGDFRIRPNDLSKYAAFHNKDGEIIKLNALYVDTTFINVDDFPKRSDSVEEVIELIRGFLESNDDHYVVLRTSANYGYEYVFNQIFKVFGVKVYVNDVRWKFYSTVTHLIPGVTNDWKTTRIFLGKVPDDFKTNKINVFPIQIKFSAWTWTSWCEDTTSIEESKNYVKVCFATHCSRSELISFVEYLNPLKVIGFPNAYKIGTPQKKSPSGKFNMSPVMSPKKQPCLLNQTSLIDRKIDAAIHRQLFG